MLKVFFSNTVNGATDAVIEELKRGTRRRVVIVPDSYTLGAEKLVMEKTGLDATLDIEVTGFMRLAQRGTGKSVLSKEGGVMVLKKVINACEKDLRHYSRVARAAGFANEVFAVIASMRLNGITPERLRGAIPDISSEATKRKNEDIALLYEGYLKALEKEGWDGTLRTEKFAEGIPRDLRLRNASYYAFGFDSLSGIQIKILSELSAVASVTIGLVRSPADPNAELMPDDSARRLFTAAGELGVTIEKPQTVNEALPEPFKTIAATLFSGSDKTAEDSSRAVTLFAEANMFEEFNAVAREIMRLTRREGFRFSDIAVIDAEPDREKELKEIFTRCRIPHYIDIRYPLKNTLAARYIAAATDMASFNMRRDKVFKALKNPLFEWDENEKFLFENYVLATNKDFNAFKEPFTGDGERFEELRRRLSALAAPFFEKNAGAAHYAAAAKALVTGDGYERRLTEFLEGADDNLAESNRRAGSKIAELLDEYTRLMGGEAETPESFRQSFDAAVAAEELALIPRSMDSVYVGKLRSGYIYRTRALFILGATQNALPQKHDFRSVISAADSMRLEDAGIRLYPTPYDSMREEQFALRDVLTRAERVYIGYPMSSGGAVNKPSGVISEIAARLKKQVVRLSDKFSPTRADTTEKLEDFAVSPENALFGYLMHRSAMSEGAAQAIEAAIGGTPYESREKSVPLLGGAGIATGRVLTSVSRIETFYRCPYAHYLRYVLKLKEREEGKLRPLDVGLISHTAMEDYFSRFLGRVHSVPRETLDMAAKDAAKNAVGRYFASLPQANASRATVRNLERSLVFFIGKLTDNVLKGNYEPVGVELSFGAGGAEPLEIPVSFGRAAMTGKIDRVDSNGRRVAVFDYKTGEAPSSPAEIYFGKKLQLAIYLKAASERFGLEPSGAFYVSLKDGYTAGGKDFRYKGFALASPEAAEEFDSGLSAGGASEVVPLRLKVDKDGEVIVAESNSALTAAEISETLDYAVKVTANALEEIARGLASRKPARGECAGCMYSEVCAGKTREERAYVPGAVPFTPRPKKEK